MVKITKYIHSCVLVETDDRVALFDPGTWSWESGLIDLDKLPNIDRIPITHEHQDHMNVDFIKAVLTKNPEAHIIANESIQKILIEQGVEATMRTESDCTRKFEAPHEDLPIPGSTPPENNGYHLRDVFTSPGDSHNFSETKQVLAMPFVSPWGSITNGVKKAIELKPKFVLPVHDWFYTEEALDWYFGLLQKSFEGTDITVLSPKSGILHEIDI